MYVWAEKNVRNSTFAHCPRKCFDRDIIRTCPQMVIMSFWEEEEKISACCTSFYVHCTCVTCDGEPSLSIWHAKLTSNLKSSRGGVGVAPLAYGAFINYVDRILPNFDHLPPGIYILQLRHPSSDGLVSEVFAKRCNVLFQWRENFAKEREYIFLNPDKKLENGLIDEVLALDSAKSYLRKQVTIGRTVTGECSLSHISKEKWKKSHFQASFWKSSSKYLGIKSCMKWLKSHILHTWLCSICNTDQN